MNAGTGDPAKSKPRPFGEEHRLPTRDGGGIVFPNGFYGPGFYLPEWEYLRYCSKTDHEAPESHSKPTWLRYLNSPSPLSWALWVAVIWAVSYALRQYYGPGAVLTAILGLLIGFFYFAAYTALYSRPLDMSETYPSVVRLSTFSHWWAHLMTAMTGWKTSTYVSVVWDCAAIGFLAVVVYSMASSGEVHWVLGISTLPLFVVLIVHPLVVTVCALLMFLRLRRRPTPADLQPVEAPGLRAI